MRGRYIVAALLLPKAAFHHIFTSNYRQINPQLLLAKLDHATRKRIRGQREHNQAEMLR